MASTPFVFFSGLLFLAWFTADVHSVKVIDVLKGSSVVLHPVEAVTSITAITWKHGDNLAAEWFGGDRFFYNIFEDGCSLNTETGELTIYNVRPEHSGVYTPDINLTTRSAMKLRVLSPVPKPTIIHDCNPEKTKCTLTCTLTCNLTCTDTCKIDTAGDLGHVEVYWILDDRHGEKGTKLQITDKDRNKTFVCSLKNPFSSENSTKLQNPLIPRDTGVPVWKPVIGTFVPLVLLALLVFVCWKWIYPKYRLYRIIKEIRETMPLTDVDQKLNKVDGVILRILREGNKRNLSEDSILKLLTARYVILRKLRQGPAVQKSLEKVQKIMKKFFRGRHGLWLSDDDFDKLLDANRVICWILDKRIELNLSEEEKIELQDVQRTLSTMITKSDDEVGQRSLNAASNDTSRPRDPAEEPLNSSSRFEAVVPV